VNEAIAKLGYIPEDYSNNNPKARGNRLWLERNLLVDDLPRAAIRQQRSMNGGGIGPWLAREAGNMMGGLMSGTSMLSMKSRRAANAAASGKMSGYGMTGMVPAGDTSAPSAGSGGMNNDIVQSSMGNNEEKWAFNAIDDAYISAVLLPEEFMARQ